MEDKRARGRILVVDDHQAVRDVVAQALEDGGYLVETAADGLEALEKVSRDSFDIMFLDVRLPGISGLDVLAKMSREFPETVVVILTAVEGVKVKNASFQHEAFAYLTKPCNLKDVTDIAERLLGDNCAEVKTLL